MNKYTLKDFEHEFPDDDTCLEWIKNHRYPNGIECPKCQRITKHHKVKNRSCYECDYCGNQVYPTAGTIFHKTTTPLKLWFQVMYRISSTRCGVSAKQIQRETGVTYKTAWRMYQQIRKLFDEDIKFIIGEVEADETYIGGKSTGKRGRGAEKKSKVFGIAQRQGKIVTKVVENVKRVTLTPIIQETVPSGSTLYTDEFHSYDRMNKMGYKHLRVNHQAKLYAIGDVHTNNIEDFWSLVKRGIHGVYHSVGTHYLQSYINEYSFRYNHRNDDLPMFKTILSRVSPSLSRVGTLS